MTKSSDDEGQRRQSFRRESLASGERVEATGRDATLTEGGGRLRFLGGRRLVRRSSGEWSCPGCSRVLATTDEQRRGPSRRAEETREARARPGSCAIARPASSACLHISRVPASLGAHLPILLRVQLPLSFDSKASRRSSPTETSKSRVVRCLAG